MSTSNSHGNNPELIKLRGSRFNCTPYYTNPPPTPNAVPPVPAKVQPAAFEPPELVKKYSSSVAQKDTPIWRSIEYMDHEGMDLLRAPGSFGAVEKWEAYLARTKVSLNLRRSPESDGWKVAEK
jgi:hypothetical protein